MNPSRRRFLRAILAGTSAVTVAGLGGLTWVTLLEPNWPAVEQVTVGLARLPARLDGLRVVQLSDLHISPYTQQSDIDRAVSLALRQKPDLIVLTGDFVWHDAGLARQLVDPLRRLRAPLGVFAVYGNHDHWAGIRQVAAALDMADITLLENQAIALVSGQERLWLAGIGDVWEEQHDLALALQPVPEEQCTLLLAHEPDVADQVAAFAVDLQLSGHSHGGQVRLPLVGPPVLPYLGRKYPQGLYRIGSLQLYTNRGIGVIAPPIRFNCRPEVTVVTLRRTKEEEEHG